MIVQFPVCGHHLSSVLLVLQKIIAPPWSWHNTSTSKSASAVSKDDERYRAQVLLCRGPRSEKEESLRLKDFWMLLFIHE